MLSQLLSKPQEKGLAVWAKPSDTIYGAGVRNIDQNTHAGSNPIGREEEKLNRKAEMPGKAGDALSEGTHHGNGLEQKKRCGDGRLWCLGSGGWGARGARGLKGVVCFRPQTH